jgi:LPXTG-motif cell wall-anchored protein
MAKEPSAGEALPNSGNWKAATIAGLATIGVAAAALFLQRRRRSEEQKKPDKQIGKAQRPVVTRSPDPHPLAARAAAQAAFERTAENQQQLQAISDAAKRASEVAHTKVLTARDDAHVDYLQDLRVRDRYR